MQINCQKTAFCPQNDTQALFFGPLPWQTNKIRYNLGLLSVKVRICRNLPRFAEVPKLVLDSPLVHDGTLFIMEHPREHDFSALPHFSQQRVYGKVNFSLFEISNEGRE